MPNKGVHVLQTKYTRKDYYDIACNLQLKLGDPTLSIFSYFQSVYLILKMHFEVALEALSRKRWTYLISEIEEGRLKSMHVKENAYSQS